MGSGPFRDTSAAIERAETLARENAELLAEIERLRGASSEAEEARAHDDTVRRLTRERDALKIELDKMRYSAPAVLDSATRKLREERDELRDALAKVNGEEHAVDMMRARLEAMQDALVRAEHDVKRLTIQRDELEKKQERLAEEFAVQIAILKERLPPSDDNRSAVMKRVMEERDELLEKVRELEERLASAPRKKR